MNPEQEVQVDCSHDNTKYEHTLIKRRKRSRSSSSCLQVMQGL